jgi:hypothetical protein
LDVPFVGTFPWATGTTSRLCHWFDGTAISNATAVPSRLSHININSDWSPDFGSESFLYCENITTLSLNPSLQSLYGSAFHGLSSVTNFPVSGSRYWKWIQEDFEEGTIDDYGAWDI